MIRRPPRSTLFPTRRSSDLFGFDRPCGPGRRRSFHRRIRSGPRSHWPLETTRSEEHTSELQSQSNLVCRLLLEKKKVNTTPTINITLEVGQVAEHVKVQANT